MHKALPSAQFLRECFNYNSRTGVLTWKERPLHHFESAHAQASSNTRNAGKSAGSKQKHGTAVNICGIRYMAHRVIWCIVYSEDPGAVEIDHKNVNPWDNRRSNLRKATPSQNKQNSSMYSSNTSGVKGVSYHQRAGKWRAQISVKGRNRSLGLFLSIEAAATAIRKARKSLHKGFANNG